MIIYILPHHLSKCVLNYIQKNKSSISKIYIIEHPKWFLRFNFHKLKLAYLRATMKCFQDILSTYIEKKKIIYINAHNIDNTGNYGKFLINSKSSQYIFEPNDKDINEYIIKNKVNIIPTNYFMIDDISHNEFINSHTNKKLVFNSFYIWYRNKFSLLMDNQNKPIGGKYSYDVKNRNKMPQKLNKEPTLLFDNSSNNKYSNSKSNVYKKEAIKYVNVKFPNNLGNLSLDKLIYPISITESEKWYNTFIKNNVLYFGPYQDAMDTRYPFGYHSISSMLLNSGLLSPEWCINKLLVYYKSPNTANSKNKNTFILQSIEGIIRQYFWREYMYFTYMYIYTDFKKINSKEQLPTTYNYWKHNKPLTKMFYHATTDLYPVDYSINLLLDYAYVDHIKRLMILLNIMTLMEIHPYDIFKWFSEITIDSASCDWVMCGNTLGFSYSDGGLITTRPYFSSSNYILTMSNFAKDDWTLIWDALYYRFINKHSNKLKYNYATSKYVVHWNNKTPQQKKKILEIAKIYFN